MPLIGDRLKQLRKARRYSQADMGKALGISQQMVAKWEQGDVEVTSDTLTRLARLLDCTTDWLLGLVENPEEHLTLRDLSADEWKLLDLYRRGALPQLIARLAAELAGAQSKEGLVVDGDDQPVVPKS